MSAIFKTQGGGGGGFFPNIFVTGLSETDTIYSAKDGKTVQGKWETRTVDETEVSGFLISPLREMGMWTVTATNGEETATQDVLVDVVTEYEIEINLSNLFLTESWSLITPITSMVQSYHAPSAAEPYFEGAVNYTDADQGKLGIDTNRAIDLTNVKTVRILVDYAFMQNIAYNPFVTLHKNRSVFWPENEALHKRINPSVTTPTFFDLDVSSVSGTYYIGVRMVGGYNPVCVNLATISSIELIRE